MISSFAQGCFNLIFSGATSLSQGRRALERGCGRYSKRVNLEREPQEGSLERGSSPRQRDSRNVLDEQMRGEGAPGSTRAGAKPQIRRQYDVLLEQTVFQHHGSPDGEGDGCKGNRVGEVGRGHI